MNKVFISLLTFALLGGFCFIQNTPLKIAIDSPLPSPHLKTNTPHDLEYLTAQSFLVDKQLIPALYSFKKASLMAQDPLQRSEATYGLIYTYFLAKKWDTLKTLYTSGIISELDEKAPYFEAALLMFYSAFEETPLPFISQNLKQCLFQNPLLKSKLELGQEIKTGLVKPSWPSEAHYLYNQYLTHRKAPLLAGFANLFIPGCGYLYLGQLQSALTAFLLLGGLLFALWTTQKQKQWALLGLIFSVFTGFYWGSVIGAGQSAALYNTQLYSAYFEPYMKEHHLFPEMHIHHAP